MKGIIENMRSVIPEIGIPRTGKERKLWEKVVDAFKENDDTIDTIIGKSYSSTTGADVIQAINIFKLYQNKDPNIGRLIIEDLPITIGQTLSDIFYWSCQKDQEVKKIQLTDSDVHTRGIGVCIVTFQSERTVIKPEDKSLEAAIYGKEDSLAQYFNALKYNSVIPVGGGIGMLNIEATENHGSAIEFFEHVDITESKDPKFNSSFDGETYISSIKDMIAFASLLGLRDLHHENLVYSKKSFFRPARKLQLIDAEVALDKSLNPSNPLATAWDTEVQGIKDTFAKNKNPFANPNFDSKTLKKKDGTPFPLTDYQGNTMDCFAFLEKVREKFRGKKSRIVFIPTGDLYLTRFVACYEGLKKETILSTNKSFFDSIIESNTFKELEIMCGKKLSISKDDAIIEKTNADFKKGRIPFWEYNFDEGKIYQKFSDGQVELISDENLKLDKIIDQRKRILNPEHAILMDFHLQSKEENGGYL